jgi:hypothetical protein
MRTRIVTTVGIGLSIALLVAGCAVGAPQAATTSHTPHAAATSVPSPTPTAPTVRVSATCDQLVPPSLVDQIAGEHLEPTSYKPRPYPSDRANARVGVLRCLWSDGDVEAEAAPWVLSLDVVPNASRDGFEGYRTGEGVGSQDSPSSLGPDSYTYCPDFGGAVCGYHALLPDYGFVGTVRNLQLGTAAKQAAVEKLLAQVYPIVAALGAPAPVWQPPAPALKGASDCGGLATAAQIASIVGITDPNVVKSDGGEYSTSIFDSDRQVGGHWCTWDPGTGGGSESVQISVLPGGATYFEQLRDKGATAQQGVGEAAYWSGAAKLDVVDHSGWLQITGVGDAVTRDQLVALAQQVLANLGTT